MGAMIPNCAWAQNEIDYLRVVAERYREALEAIASTSDGIPNQEEMIRQAAKHALDLSSCSDWR